MTIEMTSRDSFRLRGGLGFTGNVAECLSVDVRHEVWLETSDLIRSKMQNVPLLIRANVASTVKRISVDPDPLWSTLPTEGGSLAWIDMAIEVRNSTDNLLQCVVAELLPLSPAVESEPNAVPADGG